MSVNLDFATTGELYREIVRRHKTVILVVDGVGPEDGPFALRVHGKVSDLLAVIEGTLNIIRSVPGVDNIHLTQSITPPPEAPPDTAGTPSS